MATAITYDYAYNEAPGLAAMPTPEPADTWLTVSDGHFYRGATRIRFWGRMAVGGTVVPDSTARCDLIVQHCLMRGCNMLQLFLPMDRKWSHTVENNWGIMNYTPNDAGQDNTFNETAMVLLDYLIKECNENGIYIMMNNNVYSPWWLRAGLPAGSYNGHGMLWICPSARTIFKNAYQVLLTRTNTLTGLRYVDTPGLIWKLTNEEGLRDSMLGHGTQSNMGGERTGDTDYTSHWMDQITNQGVIDYPLSGNSYWNNEANATWAAAMVSAGVASFPWGTTFPTRAQCDALAFGSTDRINLMKVIGYLETTVVNELIDWVRAYNGNPVIFPGESRYFDIRATIATGRARIGSSMHIYAPDGTALNNPNAASYPQRYSQLKMSWGGTGWFSDGGNWSYGLGGGRSAAQPAMITEAGQYGENRWNYEVSYLDSVFANLQDWDGNILFQGYQQKAQFEGSGSLADHMDMRRAAQYLSSKAVAPLFRYGFITPLANSHTTTVTDTDILTAYATSANPYAKHASAAVYFQTGFPGNGEERAFLGKKLYLEKGASTNIDNSNFPRILDGAITSATLGSPLVVSPQVSLYEGALIVNNSSRCVGWINNVPGSTTLGPLTTGVISETLDSYVLFWRSDGDYLLGTGDSRLFFHGFDYANDATGFSTTTDGTTVTGRGTFAGLRLMMPDPVVLTLSVPQDQEVYGIDDAGGGTLITTTYDSGAGTIQFTTSASYPEYLIRPKATAVAAARSKSKVFAYRRK